MQGSRLAVEGKTSLGFTEKKMEKRANSLFPELYSYAYTWCPSVAFRQVITQCVQTHVRTYALMHLKECPVQPIVSLLAREQRKRRNFVVVFLAYLHLMAFKTHTRTCHSKHSVRAYYKTCSNNARTHMSTGFLQREQQPQETTLMY